MKRTIQLISFILLLLPGYLCGQESLHLENCSSQEFEINDHQDSDNDGNVCEAKITLTNSAYYADDIECDLSAIKWVVTVDIDNDGVVDLEYNSNLPVNDTNFDDSNNNGIPDIYLPPTSNNEIQNIELPDIEGPMSNHKVTWNVSDDCDLGDLCVTNFSVEDKKAPTPYCVSLSTIVFENFDIEVYAEDFNVGTFDNCTPSDEVRFSFSGDSIVPTRLVTCEDVANSPVPVDVFFWDNADNVNYCIVFLNVIPQPNVDCFPHAEIKGNVRDWKGNPLEGVEVQLDANLIEFPISTYTDSDGNYSFGYQEQYLDYTLTANDDYDYLNNVSTLDLVLIVRHILGLQEFTNPYQIIAADINGDNFIKANDVLNLRKLILGIISEISTNTAWKFLDAKFEFNDDSNPFPDLIDADPSPYSIEFSAIDPLGYDFIGVKTGDVSGG